MTTPPGGGFHSPKRRLCEACRTPVPVDLLDESGRCPSCVEQAELFTETPHGRRDFRGRWS